MRDLKFLIILFCATGFLGVHAVAAHESHEPPVTTVADVASDRMNLGDFVRHASMHLSEASSFAEALKLLNDFRKVDGDWNDGSTYLILLTRGGGVYVHSKSGETRVLEDQDWSELLSGCSGESWNDLVKARGGCVRHEGQGEGMPSGYAVSFSTAHMPFGNPDGEQFVLVGGLDYTPETEDHASFEEMVDDLVDNYVAGSLGSDAGPDFLELRMQFRELFFNAVTPEINSKDVSDREDLKQFLDEAFTFFTNSFSIPLFDPVILRRVFRFEGGPWRNLSTYIYIMDDEANVIFNGANRTIEQTNLWDFPPDSEDKFIQRIIAVAKEPGGGFVRYNWDDPEDPNDNPPDGGAGGSSPKLAYVKAFSLDKDEPVDNPRIYIFGTGLYLGNQVQPNDGACAIAGTKSSPGSTAVNLVLVAFALFLTISFKRYATSRR